MCLARASKATRTRRKRLQSINNRHFVTIDIVGSVNSGVRVSDEVTPLSISIDQISNLGQRLFHVRY